MLGQPSLYSVKRRVEVVLRPLVGSLSCGKATPVHPIVDLHRYIESKSGLASNSACEPCIANQELEPDILSLE